MSSEGWIKVARSLPDHWIYKDKVFDKTHAWLDLLMLAEYKTHKKMWRGNLTEFKRGDVCLSISALAQRWGWSRKKTRNFLGQLERDNMVTVKGTTQRTTITIVKYGDFQTRGTTKVPPKCTTELPPKCTTEDTHLKNSKESKERKEDASENCDKNEETWNGKPLSQLTDEEHLEYFNSIDFDEGGD